MAYTIFATKKLLSKLGIPHDEPPSSPTTLLGDWYATFLHWRSPPALFLNERTLLSVLVPLAPAKSVAARFGDALGQVLAALGVPDEFIEGELTHMESARFAPTASTSLVGVMSNHSQMLDHVRAVRPGLSLLSQSLDLAEVPTLMKGSSAVFPADSVRALAADPALVADLDRSAEQRRTTRADLPESDVALVERFCRTRVPDAMLHQVRLAALRRGASVTISEERPLWESDRGGSAEWTSQPLAQLRWNPRSARWSLYCADGEGRWRRYQPQARCSMELALDEIDRDPFRIFWG